MNMKYISACLLALVGLSSAHAATYTVYKTVGAHGEVKYSQQMPKDATKVEVIEFRTDGRQNTPGNMAPATVDPNATAEQNKLAEMERQMKEMQQKQQAQQCQSLQNSLNNLNMGGRIYEMNAQGERVFLSDADINARRATTQQAIAQYCSGK